MDTSLLRKMGSSWTSWAIVALVALESPLASSHGTASEPTHTYSSFHYTQVTSDRYAVPLTSLLSFATPYAPAFSEASSLLPANLTYTSYSLNPEATLTPDGQYGQSAYAAIWSNISYTESPPFTTTLSATPVAQTELVFPPQLYNGPPDTKYKLPADFIWGVAGSAWQIEGALQLEGRGPAVLDMFGAASAENSASDGNVADMNYFMYKQDMARLAAIGIPYYSFSISWSRIVPFGVAGSPINQPGLDHYDDMINACLEYGVTPIVTLNHVDMPLAVLDDPDNLPEHFLYYAKTVMTRYGDRVPYWVTFNEPNIVAGYLFGSYNVMTSLLMAHSAVYDWYKNELGGTGQITMKFANNLAVPQDPSNASHVSAAFRYQDFILGIMSNPLFLGKQYPDVVLNMSTLDLIPLTTDQISYIHGKIDFWAFDPYTAQFASPPPGGIENCIVNRSDPLWPTCVTLSNIQANGWAMGQASNAYAYIAPQYIRQQLGYVWNTFRPSGILISEFGFNPFDESIRTPDAQRYDLERSLYYQDFLQETLKAIHEDGVNVIGALAWSIMDNNEFGSYEEQYGMQTVNRTDGKFTRRYKRSMFDLVDFFHRHIQKK